MRQATREEVEEWTELAREHGYVDDEGAIALGRFVTEGQAEGKLKLTFVTPLVASHETDDGEPKEAPYMSAPRLSRCPSVGKSTRRFHPAAASPSASAPTTEAEPVTGGPVSTKRAREVAYCVQASVVAACCVRRCGGPRVVSEPTKAPAVNAGFWRGARGWGAARAALSLGARLHNGTLRSTGIGLR